MFYLKLVELVPFSMILPSLLMELRPKTAWSFHHIHADITYHGESRPCGLSNEACMVPRPCTLVWLGLKGWSRDSLLMLWRIFKMLRVDETIQIVYLCWMRTSDTCAFFHGAKAQDNKAQWALGQKRLRLITAKNRVLLDPDKTLDEVERRRGVS